MSCVEANLLVHLLDQIVVLEENLSVNDLNAIRTFQSTGNYSIAHLIQVLPLSVQRQINEQLNEILSHLVLCSGVNVKSQLPNVVSHLIKRLTNNRKEINVKTENFKKQIQAIDELYSKFNRQIQEIFIEQLKTVKANDLNTNQIETLRDQYQLLIKQMQLRRCQLIRDIYPMEMIEQLQRKKIEFDEKQHFYDEQIQRLRNLEKIMTNEGQHYQQWLKHYYQLCEELVHAQDALKRLKQQQQI